jgi:hypothetical protein
VISHGASPERGSVLHRVPAASISSVYGARTCISRKHFCSKRRAPDADIHTWILLVFFSRTSILTAARGRSREVDSSSRLKSCLAKVWCPTPGRLLTLTNRVAWISLGASGCLPAFQMNYPSAGGVHEALVGQCGAALRERCVRLTELMNEALE